MPLGAVLFEAPLRTRGRVVRGSDLQDRETLRQLLSWPTTEKRPDLAIILVDADGDSGRKVRLGSFVEDLPIRKIIAVAVQEFEAWLLADQTAVNLLFGAPQQQTPDLETMKPREAKRIFAHCAGRARLDLLKARLSMAKSCSLEELARRCRAFEDFLKALAAV